MCRVTQQVYLPKGILIRRTILEGCLNVTDRETDRHSTPMEKCVGIGRIACAARAIFALKCREI